MFFVDTHTMIATFSHSNLSNTELHKFEHVAARVACLDLVLLRHGAREIDWFCCGFAFSSSLKLAFLPATVWWFCVLLCVFVRYVMRICACAGSPICLQSTCFVRLERPFENSPDPGAVVTPSGAYLTCSACVVVIYHNLSWISARV